MEDYQQIIPPRKLKGRWLVTFIQRGSKDGKALHRDFDSYEDAVDTADDLKRQGHKVIGIPIQVSEQATPSKWKTLRSGELRGSYTDQQLRNLGFTKNPTTGQWYILRTKWDMLVKNKQISEAMNPSNTLPAAKTKTVFFVRQKRGDSWVRIAKYSYPLKAQRAIHDLQDSYEARGMEVPQFDVERVDNHPDTMYEAAQYTHNPAGLYNWRELERAVKHRASNPDDPGHVAKLRFGDQEIPFPKSGDMARLYKWVKNKLGNNKQREVFELLASPQLLNHLITSSRPPKRKLDEGKKRKSTRKSKALPRVYGGWWGYGFDNGSGDGGDGGGVEEAVEPDLNGTPKGAPKGAAKDVAKDEPKVELPPAHHAQKTQIPGTLPTYQKAYAMLNDWAPQGTTLDFGAGLGIGAKYMGSDTFEPFPRPGFQPTYTDSGAIQDGAYNRVTNLNVLNVVPKDTRDNIVKEIGRILAPGGVAIVTTRGKDVMGAKGERGPEPMSIITSIGTYQKGFTKAELQGYISGLLGKGFEVESINLGPAGVAIRKLAAPLKKRKG